MCTILKDEWLQDTHIDYFGLLLNNYSEYQLRDGELWRVQCPNTIKPVPKDKKHIQILHSCSDIMTSQNGHWVCSYYDTKNIYIYDSLNLKELHIHHKIYLEKLYPFYPFYTKLIRFPTVQLQSNNNDCGVFAIAFAVSILFGLRPDTVLYDQNLMRQHLTQMFQFNKIEHFPRIIRPNDPKQLFTLDQIKRREILANKKRERRQKKTKEENSANLPKLTSDIIVTPVETKIVQSYDNCNIINKNNDMNTATHSTHSTLENAPPIPIDNFSIDIPTSSILTDVTPGVTKINKQHNILPSLSNYNIQKVLKGEWLDDIHIEHFGLLLQINSEYQPRESWKIQCPDRIKPVPKNQKHIQILHSCSNMTTNLDGHWVCSYYDTKMIYIYDSLNLKRLHVHHRIFLEKLYPYYAFHEQSIQFPNVQKQPNGNDCGVFAIAFAVSLLFDLRPDTITYDHKLMRLHLAQIFELNRIEHFPQIVKPIHLKQLIVKDTFNKVIHNKEHINNIINIGEDVDNHKHGIKRKINCISVKSNDKPNKKFYSKQVNDVLGEAHINSVTIIADLNNDNDDKDIETKVNINSNEKLNKKCEIYPENVLLHKRHIKSLCDKKRIVNKTYYKSHRDNLLAKAKIHYKIRKKDLKRTIINKQYYESHKNDLLEKRKIYCKTRKSKICKKLENYNMQEDNTLKKRTTWNDKKDLLTFKHKKQVVEKIKKKYYRIIQINNNVRMKYSKEKYINNISEFLGMPSLSENRLEAERIAKWCFHIRELYILQMRRVLSKCKEKAEICLTRAAESSSLGFVDYVNAFCGKSKHTASSELYFREATYRIFKKSSESIIMNSEGKAINILPIIESRNKTKKVWDCSFLCKMKKSLLMT